MITKTISLSDDQTAVLDSIRAWWSKLPRTQFVFGGLAGTGKTTIISQISPALDNPRVIYCAPTGKARSVLAGKLRTYGYAGNVVTLHQMLYRPMERHCDDCPTKQSTDDNALPCHIALGEDSRCGCLLSWGDRDSDEFDDQDLIVCDESSMVSTRVYDDLCNLNIPCIFVGDHGQLPPVRDRLDLMSEPDVKLEKIHRQAERSPILKLAMMAREKGEIPYGTFGPGVAKLRKATDFDWDPDCLILTYTNKKRCHENSHIRSALGFPANRPVVGDKVMCLRNNWKARIYNGMLGEIKYIDDYPLRRDAYMASIALAGEDYTFTGLVSKDQFGQTRTLDGLPDNLTQWDYGYASTVHKAQGSEADRVILFEERMRWVGDDSWRRWLYTAVTRARNELLILQ